MLYNCQNGLYVVIFFYFQQSMRETFYLSNILPQNLENNGGFWNRFEVYCRDLTKKYNHVRVISGPLFLPFKDENDLSYIKYQVKYFYKPTRLLGYERVYLPLYKVADTPFHIQGDERRSSMRLCPFIYYICRCNIHYWGVDITELAIKVENQQI